jgi:ABC-type nitrate/sulfonate/bicarbonate transport system ATPase subunit
MCKPHVRKESLLVVDDVHVMRGDRIVLDGIDATIRNVTRPDVANQGQVVAVLGPSGAGKTTLLRVLAGLDAPDRGAVLLTEARVPVRAGMVGVVYQSYPLFAHRRVLDNLLVSGRDRDRALALLERFGLADRVDAWPCELSGGERQRVAILQQLLCDHTFLLMDEPFSGLDPICKHATCELLVEVARTHEHTTIVVVTHDIREAAKIADTLWLLRDGRITELDLIARDLAWQPGIEHTPRFQELVREVEARF